MTRIALTILIVYTASMYEAIGRERNERPQGNNSPKRSVKSEKPEKVYFTVGLMAWQNKINVSNEDIHTGKWSYLNSLDHFRPDANTTIQEIKVRSANISIDMDILVKPLWSSRYRGGIYTGPRLGITMRDYSPGGMTGFLIFGNNPKTIFTYGWGVGISNKISDTKVSFYKTSDNTLSTTEISYRRKKLYASSRDFALKNISFRLAIQYGTFGGSFKSYYFAPGIGVKI